jgi:hypothetical protein
MGSVDEEGLGQLRQGEPGGRALEAPGVLVRPEERDGSVDLLVRLETFEDQLAVMQRHRRGVELEAAVRP